jgi:DNA-binding response OmpR family regulator
VALLFSLVEAVRTIGGDMRWSTGSVLIVDREDETVKILRTALQSTDFVLFNATTGDEALAVLSRLKYTLDLIVIDLDLARDESLIVSLLTILGRRNATKIIVKTSRQDRPFLESVNYFGIDAIILKPIAEEQFVKTVQEALSGHRNDSAGTSAGTAA